MLKIIQMLSNKIEESIESAEEYMEAAIEYKNDYPDVAKALFNVSESEMTIMSLLHSTVAKVISDYRKTNGEPPAPMMAVYEYLHKKHIDGAARVKAMQQMFKES